MAERVPLVSIGMPAYNRAGTLRSAVDSLLAQSFGDFELVISDNASTDATWSIITEYMKLDTRVRGVRQASNIGANANYSAVFCAARGTYFKWASSNDWCAPTLLRRCVEVLDSDASTVLVAPGTRLFQKVIADFVDYGADIACVQDDPVARFAHVDTHLALNNAVNGLVRADVLRRTSLVEHYPGADIVLVAQLALFGRIRLLSEPLFYRRMDEATATRMMSARALHRHHYPVNTWRSVLPSWRLAWGWTRAALSGHLSFTDNARALLWVVRRTYWKRAQLGRDLLDVVRYKHH